MKIHDTYSTGDQGQDSTAVASVQNESKAVEYNMTDVYSKIIDEADNDIKMIECSAYGTNRQPQYNDIINNKPHPSQDSPDYVNYVNDYL